MNRRTLILVSGAFRATFAGCLGNGLPESGSVDTASRPTSGKTERTTTAGGPTTDQSSSRLTPVQQGYETTKIQITSPDGEKVDEVIAGIANTRELRCLCLSETESLPNDRGMLSVYDLSASCTK
jgi:hypothetical protein